MIKIEIKAIMAILSFFVGINEISGPGDRKKTTMEAQINHNATIPWS